jgi:hypothetical protein
MEEEGSSHKTEKQKGHDAYISPSRSRKTGGAAPQRPARTHTVLLDLLDLT